MRSGSEALACFLAATLPGAAGAAPAEPPPPAKTYKKPVVDWLPHTLMVRAELTAKSPPPKLEQITVYREALAVYEYRVVEVFSGTWPGEHILVTHWVVKQNIEQPVVRNEVGGLAILKLRPFDDLIGLNEVHRSDAVNKTDLPMFHDVGQRLSLPPEPKQRWNYGVEVGAKMPVFFGLKDQLRLVVLGDCQAAVAHQAQLYLGEQNRETPLAYNLCQERACLQFQKLLVDTYLVHLPRLEAVVFSWTPRLLNGSWKTHGLKYGAIVKSPGYQYDRDNGFLWRAPSAVGAIRAADMPNYPVLGMLWKERPYGWRPTGKKVGFWTDPFGQMKAAAKLEGTYVFSQERWDLFLSIVRALAARKVRMLVFIPPYHPATAERPVKDKDGITAKGYQDQVARLTALEQQYAGLFFFRDVNRMGLHGLLNADDFGDVDHPNDTGGEKLTRYIEQWRLEVDGKRDTPVPPLGR